MPLIRYPEPLLPGQRVFVTAPSSGVLPAHHARLAMALQNLRSQGLVVEEGACLRSECQGASAPAVARAAELMSALLRPDIHAVIPPWGGELTMQILDLLDWPALQAARPRWCLGYSDTSTWLLPLSLRLGWATAHGPCLMDLVPSQDDTLTSRVMSHLRLAPGSSFTQTQSTAWQKTWVDFAVNPQTTFELTEPTQWWPMHGDDQITMRGRLIGGCLDTLMTLAGSPYGDVPSFIRHAQADGCILYLENAELSPTGVVRALHGLRWAGWLDGLSGVLIGRSAASDTNAAHALRYQDALRQTMRSLPYPVLADVDVGHLPPQMLLINGALAEVTWSPSAGGQVVQHLA